MRRYRLSWLVAGAIVSVLRLSGYALVSEPAEAGPSPAPGRGLESQMLTGTVRSAGGPALDGVTVSARAVDKTFTTTVFTDERGQYVFPELDDGQYKVWAQAVGYEAGRASVGLDSRRDVRQDFALTALQDITSQLTGAEWMAALPEDTPRHRRMKEVVRNNCLDCHPPGFFLQNRFDEAGWRAVIDAMGRYDTLGEWFPAGEPPPAARHANVRHFNDELVQYLTEMRGPGPSPMTFQPLSRPRGDAARVVITEYDVEPAETPGQLAVHDGSDWSEGVPSAFLNRGIHDVAVDSLGNAWIAESEPNVHRTYARIDSKTGKVTPFAVPAEDGFSRGSHGITAGPDGGLWISLRPGSLGRIDPSTEKLEIFTPPEGMSGAGGHLEVDGKGKVWASTDGGILRFDPDTGEFMKFSSLTPGTSNYGVGADADGNGWWAQISHDLLGVSDIATGKSREIPLRPREEKLEIVPAEDRAFYRQDRAPERGYPWSQTPRRLGGDRFSGGTSMWVANWVGQNIARVDTRTFQVSYYPLPIADANAYDVDVDKNHIVYTAFQNSDMIGRFDPATEEWTVYRLPTRGTAARQITVDYQTGDVWVPYWMTSKVARLQFRATTN